MPGYSAVWTVVTSLPPTVAVARTVTEPAATDADRVANDW